MPKTLTTLPFKKITISTAEKWSKLRKMVKIALNSHHYINPRCQMTEEHSLIEAYVHTRRMYPLFGQFRLV
jgi:hypothetical protein